MEDYQKARSYSGLEWELATLVAEKLLRCS